MGKDAPQKANKRIEPYKIHSISKANAPMAGSSAYDNLPPLPKGYIYTSPNTISSRKAIAEFAKRAKFFSEPLGAVPRQPRTPVKPRSVSTLFKILIESNLMMPDSCHFDNS